MYQEITIVGRLGRDPEMRFTESGTPVTTFSVATDRQFTDGSGKVVKETTWFRVAAWNKQAEACNNYLSKGKLVLITGRLLINPKTGGPRIWKDHEGESHTSFEVVVNQIKFLSPKDEGLDSESGIAAPEDIPF